MQKINFKNGIRFECQNSGNCCVSRDSYGYVYLSSKDLKKLARNFNLTAEDFKFKYCQNTEGFLHLKEKNRLKGKCIFLKNHKCTVYKSGPSQCRTWPFWNENMNAKSWNENVVNFCPGIGKGNIVNFEKIKKIIAIDKKEERKIAKIKMS